MYWYSNYRCLKYNYTILIPNSSIQGWTSYTKWYKPNKISIIEKTSLEVFFESSAQIFLKINHKFCFLLIDITNIQIEFLESFWSISFSFKQFLQPFCILLNSRINVRSFRYAIFTILMTMRLFWTHDTARHFIIDKE